MEERKPRTGETVRILLEARCEVTEHGDLLVWSESAADWVPVPEEATVTVVEPPLCREMENATGIRCSLPKDHVLPDGSLRTVHEGVTTADQAEAAGYELFVRWPADGASLPTPAVTAEEVEQIGQWLAANQPGRESQVFTFPGPQPPASVTTLEWLDSNPDARDYQFLHRVGDGWLWWDRATPPEKWSAAPNSWDRAARTSPGRYREVV